MNKISKQRRSELDEYRKASKAWLVVNGQCEGCHRGKATEVHHSRGRIHGLLNDKRYWVALCKHCHDFVHRHPQAAREAGLLCQPGEWNKVDRTPIK